MSFGRSMAFHPLIDLLRRNFRIEESDTEEMIVAKVERGVLRLGEDLRPILPYLRYLLSVDPGDAAVLAMDPQQRRGEIFDALRRLTLRASEVRPQVTVFEDAHWMDQATEAYLLFMADSIPTSRVLRILTYRPGYVQPFGERTYHTRIALNTLSTEHSVEMAQALLATESLPEALKALIVRKAEGNPFFVEEVVKSLLEVGALRRAGDGYVLAKRLDEIFVPDTIQDVIMARIDRLEEAPKRTLQLASVIGREFTRRLLDRIADIRARTEEFLQELKAIELIYEKSVFPELAYMFKHALTHEVAYNSLLVQRRKELHRLIALAIEELYAERLAEQYEVLAYHFSRGEEWAKALEYLLKAAEKAAQAFATREAIALYDQALEAAGQLGAAVDARTLMAIHQAKSNLYFVLSDFERSRAEGERFLTLAREAQDRVSEGAALVGMAHASRWAHDFDQALAYARQAIAVAEEGDARAALAGGHFITGIIHSTTGRLDQAKEEIDQALTISRSGGDIFHQSLSLNRTGQLKNWEGEYVEASRLSSEALEIAREHNLLVPLLDGLFAYGLTLTGKGDYDAALAMLEEGLALSGKVGNEVWHHRLLNSLGWLYIELGDLDRALDLNQQSAEGARKRGDPEMIANAELNLGDVFLAKGDLVMAQEYPRCGLSSRARSGDQRVDEVALLDPSFCEPGRTLAGPGGSCSSTGVRRPVPGTRHAYQLAEIPGQGLAAHGRDRPRPPPVGRGGEGAPAGSDHRPGHRQPDAALEDPPRLWSSLHSDQEARDGSTGLWRCPRCYRARQGQSARSRAARQPGEFPADASRLRSVRLLTCFATLSGTTASLTWAPK